MRETLVKQNYLEVETPMMHPIPGGATAYMMQEVIDKQGGFNWLDAPARCLSAPPHRPAYSSDGDYFSKPNVENVVDTVYEMMREVDPTSFPAIYF